jgi:hypothetical protein
METSLRLHDRFPLDQAPRHQPPARYPRTNEPLLPAALRPFLAGRILDGAPQEELRSADLTALAWQRHDPAVCRRLAAQICEALRFVLSDGSSQPPPWTRQILLPDPDHLLRTRQLDVRTFTLLSRRVSEITFVGAWTAHRYLGIKGFGARLLLDVLSAVEAQGQKPPASLDTAPSNTLEDEIRWVKAWDHRRHINRTARSTSWNAGTACVPPTPMLDRAAALTHRSLPLPVSAADEQLARAGIGNGRAGVREVAHALTLLGRPVPFQSTRYAGIQLLVSDGEAVAAKRAYAIAVRMMRDWGLSSVRIVAHRLHAMTGVMRNETVVARFLSAAPAFVWLDQDDGWFRLSDRACRLVPRIVEIVRDRRDVDVSAIHEELFGKEAPLLRPTLAALRTLITAARL